MPPIGEMLLSTSRARRNYAHLVALHASRFAVSVSSCHAGVVASVSQSNAGASYHFRTTSYGGQKLFPNSFLSAFFLRADAAYRPAPRAGLRPCRQDRAHHVPPAIDQLTFADVRIAKSKTSRGKNQWHSNQSFLPLSQRLASRPAVIRWANRPLSAGLSAQVPQRSPVAASSLASPLARLETFLRANSTSQTADHLTRVASENLKLSHRRRASLRGGVLRVTPKTSEAPCSKSF
jgi:hypothetical protein